MVHRNENTQELEVVQMDDNILTGFIWKTSCKLSIATIQS